MMAQLRQFFGICVIAAAVVSAVLLMTSWSQARLISAQDEAARLIEHEVALLVRLDEAKRIEADQVAMPRGYLWVGEGRAVLEITFQQALVDAAETSGLRLISFGPGRPPDAISAPALGYEVEVEGGHEEVARFLQQIEAHDPQLGYSYLWMRQQANGADAPGKALMSARIGVWGFTDAPEGEAAP